MRQWILCLVFLLALNMPVFAVDENSLREALPEEAGTYIEDVPSGAGFSEGIAAIMEKVFPTVLPTFHAALRSVSVMLAALILCALSQKDGTLMPATIAGVFAICTAGMLEMQSLAACGQEALYQMQSFGDLLLPAMAASTAATGGITSSSAIYAGTAFFTDVLMHGFSGIFLPMTYAYVAVSAAHALCDYDLLSRIAGLIKWTIQTGLKLCLFLFLAYMGLTGLFSGSADATAVKAAKLTLSGVVPVVGSMISDASETVILGALTLKNAMGIFGMLAVVSICIGPFLRTGISYLVMKLSTAAGSALGTKPLISLMDAITDAMGFLLAMTGTGGILLLISCVCYLKVTTA